MNARSAAQVVAVLAASLLIGPARAAIETIAISGDSPPEANGLFAGFSVTAATAPVLNNSGQVAFWASLFNTSGATNDDTGIYLYDGTTLTNLVRENASIPEGGGRFNVLSDVPSMNDAGQVAFDSSLRDTPFETNVGSYLHNGSTLVKLARRGEPLPDGNGDFSQSLNTTVNSAGHVRFKASLTRTSGGGNDDLGIYLHNGSGLVKLARENEEVPEGDGLFSDFFDFKQGFNDADQVAFQASLRNTSGGTIDNEGIYLHNGTALVNLARENETVPEGNGRFASFLPLAQVNSVGEVAFLASLRNTSGATLDDNGIYLHNGSALVKLVRENDNVPDGNHRFADFELIFLNDAGQLAFSARLRNNVSPFNDGGIYFYNGSALVKYVREDDNVPEGNGKFETFSRLHLNATGQVAFKSFLRNTSGGLSDDNAIYVTDGIETVKVAREGEMLEGTVITFLDTTGGYSLDLDLRKSFNDFGQVAFRAVGANGGQGIFLFTPEIRWRSTMSGSWDTVGNWRLSLSPGAPHDVSINPTSSLTVTGPASDVTVRSVTVGDGIAADQPTLNLQAGSLLMATDAIHLQEDATIVFEIGGTGTADFARLTTNGIATLDGALAVSLINGFTPSGGQQFTIVTAGTIVNNGLVLSGSAASSFTLLVNSTSVILQAIGVGLPGDYNGDNVVDASDYVVWRKNDGSQGSYDTWRAHFGETAGSGALSKVTAPEPASGLLLILGAAVLIWSERRITSRV